MAALGTSDVLAVLKEIYPNGDVPHELLYKVNPLFALMDKDEDAYGELVKVPLIYGDPQGRSASFTNAQGNQTAGKYTAFDVTVVSDYSTAQLTGEAIDKTRKDKGSFVRALKREVDGSLRQLTRSAVHAMYRNGGGAIGIISSDSTVASTTIKLATKQDIVFFEVGQELTADDTDGTAGGAVRTGSATVTAVNRRTGELTSDGNWSTQITGLATGDYLFVQGDFGAKMTGLLGWLPTTDPSASEDFFGVDRSVDRTRLAGVVYNGTSQTIREAIIDGVQECVDNGGMPDTIFMNPSDIVSLVKHLESQRVYGERKTADGAFGFRTLMLESAVGTIDIIGDINCPKSYAFPLQMDTWTLYSMGKVPRILDDDGLPYLRTASSDGIELRNVYRAQVACEGPGLNGVLQLPT